MRAIITNVMKRCVSNSTGRQTNTLFNMNKFLYNNNLSKMNFSNCGSQNGNKNECKNEKCENKGNCDKNNNHDHNHEHVHTDNCSHSNNTNNQPEPKVNNECGNAQCGCHPTAHSGPTKEDEIEMELKAKHFKVVQAIEHGKYDEALDLSEDFINAVKTNYGDEHPFYCSALNNKAFILKTCGEFDEAITLFQEVVEKYQKLYGENNEKVLITLHNLGTVLKEAGQFEKSLEIYQKILKMISENHIPIEGEKRGKLRLNIFANIYNSAGGLYRQLKNYNEADKLFNLALNLIKTNFGDDSPPIATVLNNIALSLKDQGKLDDAMENYQKALNIRKNNQGLDDDHPEVKMLLHNIEQLNIEISKRDFANNNKNI